MKLLNYLLIFLLLFCSPCYGWEPSPFEGWEMKNVRYKADSGTDSYWSANFHNKDKYSVKVKIEYNARRWRNFFPHDNENRFTDEIQLKNYGTVEYDFHMGLFTSAAQNDSLPSLSGRRSYYLDYGTKEIIFSNNINAKKQTRLTSRDLKIPEKKKLREKEKSEFLILVNKSKSDNPTLDLISKWLNKSVALSSHRIIETSPDIHAIVNNGPKLKLKQISNEDNRSSRTEYTLNAKPGDKIELVFRLSANKFIAGTDFLKIENNTNNLASLEVVLNKTVYYTNKEGIVRINYGKLKSPEKIRFRVKHWTSHIESLNIDVFLRWGRKKENALNNKTYDLSLPEDNSVGNIINCILKDLDSAYNPDEDSWFTKGDTEEYGILYNYPNHEYDNLKKLKPSIEKWTDYWCNKYYSYWSLSNEEKNIDRSSSDFWVKFIGLSNYQKKYLIKSKSKSTKYAWHSVEHVYLLSCIYKHRKSLRNNSLFTVLDFWAESIPHENLPYEDYGKAQYRNSFNLENFILAVITLETGYKFTKNKKYLIASRILGKKITEYISSEKFTKILNGKQWFDNMYETKEKLRDIIIYGQYCAYRKNLKELDKIQKFIVKMFTHKNSSSRWYYRKSSASDRIGMIHVLMSSPGFLNPPPTLTGESGYEE